MLAEATKILSTLGVTLNVEKTRIVHVTTGFEFLGYKIKRGSRPLKLALRKIRTGGRPGDLYAYPRQKSIEHFKEQIRQRTRRKAPVSTRELIADQSGHPRLGSVLSARPISASSSPNSTVDPATIWSQRFKRWRCRGWRRLPERQLYGELGLVRLICLIPSLNLRR